ncbi:MAG TPA: hypothetical protein VH087_03185 [Thermoanaerobaculia bacterium]|nr:hypothetical protein [Thermoanaerobaculia bacterium]
MNEFTEEELWTALMRAHCVFMADLAKSLQRQNSSLTEERNENFTEINRRLNELIELMVDTRKVAERAARIHLSS